MKVKIGDTYYYPSIEAIMLVLSKEDRRLIEEMPTDHTKLCQAPCHYTTEQIEDFMDLTSEEKTRCREAE